MAREGQYHGYFNKQPAAKARLQAYEYALNVAAGAKPKPVKPSHNWLRDVRLEPTSEGKVLVVSECQQGCEVRCIAESGSWADLARAKYDAFMAHAYPSHKKVAA